MKTEQEVSQGAWSLLPQRLTLMSMEVLASLETMPHFFHGDSLVTLLPQSTAWTQRTREGQAASSHNQKEAELGFKPSPRLSTPAPHHPQGDEGVGIGCQRRATFGTGLGEL